MSARSVKHVLADFGGVSVGEIEEVWHAQQPPYLDLFAWLEKRGPKPDSKDAVTFHPVMLAHPLEDADLSGITPDGFLAEWKYRRHPRADCIHAQRQGGVLPQRR